MDTLNLLVSSLGTLASVTTLMMLAIGVVVGLLLGLVPGLSGATGMAILIPLAFQFDTSSALALLLGMYTASTISDILPSVLLGIPGSAASQAQVLDGYPMTKRGEGNRAIGATYGADIFAAAIGMLMVIILFPLLTSIAMALAAPEMFVLVILAVSFVGVISGGKGMRTKGIMMGLLGVLLALVGLSYGTGVPRYTFDSNYLWDGIPIVPAIVGLFGLSEMVRLYVRNEKIAKEDVTGGRSGFSGVLEGFKDVWRHKFLAVRASVIGGGIGFLPGISGSVADWIGYAHAVQTSKDPKKFGKGAPEGLVASEAAVAASKPLSVVPTIVFGVPGSVPLAILLGALLVLGVQPGPGILTTNPTLLFSLMWMILIANIIGVAMALLTGSSMARIAGIRPDVLVPFIFVFLALGSVATTASVGDLVVFAVFGLLGLFMDWAGWPKPPLVLGLVLGSMAEVYLFISHGAYGWSWIDRPIVIGAFVGVVLLTAFSVYRQRRLARVRNKVAARASAEVAEQ